MHHQHWGLAELLQGYYVPNSLQLERGEARPSPFFNPFPNHKKEITPASFYPLHPSCSCLPFLHLYNSTFKQSGAREVASEIWGASGKAFADEGEAVMESLKKKKKHRKRVIKGRGVFLGGGELEKEREEKEGSCWGR